MREELVRDLKGMGVRPGDLVMVHSSMRSVGPILGGPNEMIEALLESVGPSGTVMMYIDWEEGAQIVNPTAEGFAVLWMTCPNPLLGFREILDQSRASGWEGPSAKDVPMATQEDREAEFRKPGTVRRVCLRIMGSGGAWYLTLRDELER